MPRLQCEPVENPVRSMGDGKRRRAIPISQNPQNTKLEGRSEAEMVVEAPENPPDYGSRNGKAKSERPSCP